MADDSSPRITDRAERNAATSFRDHGPEGTTEAVAVTGRPNDPVPPNTTFADRAKERGAKAVDSADVEDKAVGRSERKSTKGRR